MAGPHAEGFGEGRDFPAAGLAALQRGLFGGGGREREAAGRAQRAAAGHPPGGLAGRAPASVRGPRWARGCSLAPEGALEAWGAACEQAAAGRPGPAAAGCPAPPPAGAPVHNQAARGRFAVPARNPPPPRGAPPAGLRWSQPSGPPPGWGAARPNGGGSAGLLGGIGRLGGAQAGRSAGPTSLSRAGASGVLRRVSGAPKRLGARKALEGPPMHGMLRAAPGGGPLSSYPCAAAAMASRVGGRALPAGHPLGPVPGLERGR